MAERLTSHDTDIIIRALDLANAGASTDALRAFTGTKSTDPALVQGEALGAAQYLLRELVAIIEGLASDRVTGKGPRP